MKIEKILKTFAIAAVMAGSVFTFSQTTEAVATVSIEKAAQKIYKAETKAYNTKKDVSVTVKIASPLRTKKAISKVTGELENALIKEELGDVDLTYVVRNTYVRPSIGEFIDHIGISNCHSKGTKARIFYYPSNDAAFQTATYKNGVLTIKFDIKGSKKWYRDQYYENTCLAKCVEELREQTAGMSEKDKAWTVAQWVDERFVYSGKYSDGSRTAYHIFLEAGTGENPSASGECEQQARAYQLFECLMGMNAGFVTSGSAHAFGCVKIDGEVYYYDGTESKTDEWNAMTLDAEKFAKNCVIDNFKEWVDGTTVGEWCLLTADEYVQTVSLSTEPSEWTIYWKLGSWFF